MSRANVRAEDLAGAQEGVLIIYKVNLSSKVFEIFAEKRSIMWTAKGGKIWRRGAEKGESQGVAGKMQVADN